jgi:prepilin-type N-terminal cleavage/methylation domain-containing protein
MRKGFTIIELLVVVAIIGLLSSVILASMNKSRGRARDTRRSEDVKQLVNAVNLYATENGPFPLGAGIVACIGKNDGETCWDTFAYAGNTALNTGLQPFLKVLPKEPLPSRGVGDAYLYTTHTMPVNCSAPYIEGPFILYRAEEIYPTVSVANSCKMGGMFSCFSGVYLCAVKI